MKFNKQLAIILILLSMLLSAIAVSVYFYNQNQEVHKSKNQLVTIFIANKNIKKGTLITDEHIKQTTVARQYILTKPLLKKEILNKFAKEPIYLNESFLKEKLIVKIETEKKEVMSYKYNSYNISYSLFQNPNYSLNPNDIIKIISVYPKSKKNDSNKFSVQYVAKNIRILGFIREGYSSEKAMIKKKVKKLVKKKQVEEIVDLKADEIILDIKQDVLLSLINDYNKGKQLWMVKSKLEEEKTHEKKVEKKKLKKVLDKPRKKYIPKKRTYPVKWYKPSTSTTTKTALISYANNKDLVQTKKAKITSSFNKECSNTKKLLITTSNIIYLRTHPSNRAKIHKKIYKNYILPYTNISKINNDWYMLCDGSYVQKKDTKSIKYEEYKRLK